MLGTPNHDQSSLIGWTFNTWPGTGDTGIDFHLRAGTQIHGWMMDESTDG